MLFKDIPGNISVKKQLIAAVNNNRVSHAQMFYGRKGSAKLAIALAYAQFLNCENKNTEDSCNTCLSCLKHSNFSHPDLHIVYPVLKTKNTKKPISDHFIENWREFVKEKPYGSLSDWIDFFGTEKKQNQKGVISVDEVKNIHKKLILKNYEAKYRIVLIWMPERMELKTSNRLLKLFEEPPKRTVFVLVSENTNQLLPTIKSRIQTIKIQDFTPKNIVSYFKKKNLSLQKANELINLTEANLEKIRQILFKTENNNGLFSDFASWVRLSYKMDIKAMSKWVEEMSLKGRKQQKLFLSYATKMIRECLVYNFGSKNLLKTNEKEFKFIINFSPFIHERNSVLIVEKIEQSIQSIDRNANPKILLFDLTLQVAKLLKYKSRLIVK